MAHTRSVIVDAAMTLFAERGYNETTVEDVAAAALVSPATVFRYFGSKEDLMFSDERPALIPTLIAERPDDESDVQAVEAALRATLGAGPFTVERVTVMRQALEKSAVLRGRSVSQLTVWTDAIARGLADRHAASPADPHLRLRARVLVTALTTAFDELANRNAPDMASALQLAFRQLEHLIDTWPDPKIRS
jgi:AcrR family transcriptional regulator